MTAQANAARGEAVLRTENAAFMLRPTFAALAAAEEELGSLFALVERAANGLVKARAAGLGPAGYKLARFARKSAMWALA